jgi:hypothetical protein
MKSFISLLQASLFAATAFLSGVASSETVVLDSTVEDNAVSLSLDAGSYYIEYVSGSWNAWEDVAGCDQNGEYCARGWLNSYFFHNAESSGLVSDGILYATSAQAEAAGVARGPLQFTLTQADELTLQIPDNLFTDNSGSIMLSVRAVPEPSEAVMILSGLALIGALTRRRMAG